MPVRPAPQIQYGEIVTKRPAISVSTRSFRSAVDSRGRRESPTERSPQPAFDPASCCGGGRNCNHRARRRARVALRPSTQRRGREAFVADRPLRLSMNAFSTGLPGRMNSSHTSCVYAHPSLARPTNSPLSTVIAVGAPRRATIGVSAAAIFTPVSDRSATRASASRVNTRPVVHWNEPRAARRWLRR